MIVEVIAVGTELLLGQITNTNGSTIGVRLAEQGFDAHYQVVVGDNLIRASGAIRSAVERADAVILTGGIGPTQDDITREAICTAMGLDMRFSEAWADELRERWARAGRDLAPSNLRQAEYPDGAKLLRNPKGTAPGLMLRFNGTLIFAIPGVPAEMEFLLESEVLPRLAEEAGSGEAIVNRVLKSWGRAESEIADLLADVYPTSINPSLAFLASDGEIKIRLTAKAGTAVEAHALIEPLETAVRERLTWSIFATDDTTVESLVLDDLVDRGWTLGTAESVSGGLLAGRITAIPGASSVFVGSIVSYSPEVKADLLGVDTSEGVVTEEVARQMAVGAQSRLGVDVAVSLTGSAGPERLEQDVGTVIVGLSTPARTDAKTLRLPGDRERVRSYATTAALHILRLALQDQWPANP